MGFPWRFHPCVEYIKNNIEKLGVIRMANFIGGSYLPDWHPKQDYRKSYSAKKHGGGITLDATHEFDLFLHLFGPVRAGCNFKGQISDLEIESDDYSLTYMNHENGVCSSIVADYIRRFRRRELEIVGDNGTMLVDFLNSRITTKIVKKRSIVKNFKNYDLNKMYIKQMEAFINGKGASLDEGLQVCKLLEDM
jgi:predicted dehydrogenase